jgi:hypothetical protein
LVELSDQVGKPWLTGGGLTKLRELAQQKWIGREVNLIAVVMG